MKNKNSKYFYPRSFLYSLALFPCGYGRAQLLTVRIGWQNIQCSFRPNSQPIKEPKVQKREERKLNFALALIRSRSAHLLPNR